MARGARRGKRSMRAELAPLYQLQLRWHQGRGDMGHLLEVERYAPLLAENRIVEGQELLALAARLFRESDPHGHDELLQALEILERWRSKNTGVIAARWQMLMQAGWAAEPGGCWQCGHAFSAQIQPLWSHGALHCTVCDNGKLLERDALQQITTAWKDPDVSLSEPHRILWQKMADSILYYIHF